MSKKLKLNSMTQTNGEDQSKDYRTLDQIWGDEGLSKYKTLDEAEYESGLSQMNDTDLTSHAIKLGFAPTPDRQILKKRLVAEFKKYAAQFSRAEKQNEKTKVSKEALRILSEGR